MKIGFIGGGNMAEAILASVLAKKLAGPEDLSVSDVLDSRLSYLEQKYRISASKDNRKAVKDKTIVILAVKPQTFNDVAAGLKGSLLPTQLVISIIAGKNIHNLSSNLDHNCLVRSMPNTPARIGEGITVWTATPQVNAQQKKWAASILGVMGTEIFVADEKYLDMATAVSGSGPAYVFLFIEAFESAAVKLGFAPEVARRLVMQTLQGSVHLLQKSGQAPQELRQMVTSPGGTTAEAIAVLEKCGFASLIENAITAAYERAKELGG